MKSKIYVFFLAVLLLAGVSFAKQEQPVADDTIIDLVRIKLSGDQVVKGSSLQVDVKEGVVTLSGHVDTSKAKDRAEKLTKKTKGVKQVINKLTFK